MTEILWRQIIHSIPYCLAAFGIVLGAGISIIAACMISHTRSHGHFLKHHLQDAAQVELRDAAEKIRTLTAQRNALFEDNQQLSTIVRAVHASLGLNLPGPYLVKPGRKSG